MRRGQQIRRRDKSTVAGLCAVRLPFECVPDEIFRNRSKIAVRFAATRTLVIQREFMAEKPSNDFVLSLTKAQPTIYACIYALLPDRGAAHDLLQETNLTLLRKAGDFEPGTNFNAWATRIARYQVLNHRRKMSRDRLVFDDSLIEELCERQMQRSDELCRYSDAIRKCLQQLPASHRQILERRYAPGGTVAEIASAERKSVGAISQLLYRLRQSLMDCVYQRLQEGAP